MTTTEELMVNRYQERILIWINEINSPSLKKLVQDYFENYVPDYFWTKPASSSGKYHPLIDRGEGGLVNHTCMVCYIAYEMLELYPNLNDESDIIYSALLIHDSFKYGDPKNNLDHTIHEHPIMSAEEFRKFYEGNNPDPDLKYAVDKICDAVKSHHGKWTTSKYSKLILPTPVTELQKFVHMCDYIASRQFIGNFDLYNE